MGAPAKVIENVLSLPREQRAELATTLLRSLDEGDDEEPSLVEATWAQEIDRRIADRDAGRTGSAPLGSAMGGITARLAAQRDRSNR